MHKTLKDVAGGMDLPKGKPKRLKWILLGVGVLIVAALVTTAALLFQETRVVDYRFEAGNNNYDKGFEELESALLMLAKVEIDAHDPGALEKESARISKKIPKALRYFDKADEHFAQMKKAALYEWEIETATDARKSVRQARIGARELSEKLEQLSSVVVALKNVREASDKFSEGFILTNTAINAGNDDKFEDARQQSIEGGKLFSSARSLLAQAAESFSDRDLSKAGEKIRLAQQWAEGAGKMATAGIDEQLDAYNRLAKVNNRLSEQITDAARDPIMTQPDKWMRDRLDRQDARIQEAFDKADTYREQALRLWEANT
jgi:hypothetical protein